jgi:hypothetical protein
MEALLEARREVLSPPITWIEALVALLEVGLSALLLGLFFTDRAGLFFLGLPPFRRLACGFFSEPLQSQPG